MNNFEEQTKQMVERGKQATACQESIESTLPAGGSIGEGHKLGQI